jgi:hypothetical protein
MFTLTKLQANVTRQRDLLYLLINLLMVHKIVDIWQQEVAYFGPQYKNLGGVHYVPLNTISHVDWYFFCWWKFIERQNSFLKRECSVKIN